MAVSRPVLSRLHLHLFQRAASFAARAVPAISAQAIITFSRAHPLHPPTRSLSATWTAHPAALLLHSTSAATAAHQRGLLARPAPAALLAAIHSRRGAAAAVAATAMAPHSSAAANGTTTAVDVDRDNFQAGPRIPPWFDTPACNHHLQQFLPVYCCWEKALARHVALQPHSPYNPFTHSTSFFALPPRPLLSPYSASPSSPPTPVRPPAAACCALLRPCFPMWRRPSTSAPSSQSTAR